MRTSTIDTSCQHLCGEKGKGMFRIERDKQWEKGNGGEINEVSGFLAFKRRSTGILLRPSCSGIDKGTFDHHQSRAKGREWARPKTKAYLSPQSSAA